jgi:hypothetical protein
MIKMMIPRILICFVLITMLILVFASCTMVGYEIDGKHETEDAQKRRVSRQAGHFLYPYLLLIHQ